MNIFDVILIGIALAMDAFGVSLGIGVNSHVSKNEKILYDISFGFFQFLFIFLGGILGYFFNTYVTSIPNVLGGIVIGALGIFMIIEGFKEKEESILAKKGMILILGISVSIDALVIGFSAFSNVTAISVLCINSVLVGLITSFLCLIAFFICKFIRRINYISKYADFFGGIALILFALKMLFF